MPGLSSVRLRRFEHFQHDRPIALRHSCQHVRLPDAGHAVIRTNPDSGIRQKRMSGIPSTQPSLHAADVTGCLRERAPPYNGRPRLVLSSVRRTRRCLTDRCAFVKFGTVSSVAMLNQVGRYAVPRRRAVGRSARVPPHQFLPCLPVGSPIKVRPRNSDLPSSHTSVLEAANSRGSQFWDNSSCQVPSR